MERLDIKRRETFDLTVLHDCLQANGLPISRGPIHDQATLRAFSRALHEVTVGEHTFQGIWRSLYIFSEEKNP